MRHRLLSPAVPVRGAVRWSRWVLTSARGAIAAGLVVALGAAGLPVVAGYDGPTGNGTPHGLAGL